MSCIDSFQKSLDFIEQNLTHEITLSQCADSAGYSPFHYCRAFHMLTGMSVMDYIRKRRLSKAAIDLLDSGKIIRQVAFDWGFNSHEILSGLLVRSMEYLHLLIENPDTALPFLEELTWSKKILEGYAVE